MKYNRTNIKGFIIITYFILPHPVNTRDRYSVGFSIDHSNSKLFILTKIASFIVTTTVVVFILGMSKMNEKAILPLSRRQITLLCVLVTFV